MPGVVTDAAAGAGVTHGNVKQLLLHTGAKEVHIGSACQENVPRAVLRKDATVCLGFVGEGTYLWDSLCWSNTLHRALSLSLKKIVQIETCAGYGRFASED